MPGRLGPRFAIEALFLIALAAGAAYADLASKWIVLVMAGGWLLVALLELAADRIWAEAPPWRRPYYMPVSPPRAEPVASPRPSPPAPEPVPAVEPSREPAAAAEPEPAHEPEPEPVPEPEAATVIVPRAPEPEAEPEREPEPEPVAGEVLRPKLEPLEPEPKRRWFRRRKPEDTVELAPEPEPPKHVRLLPASERTGRVSDDVSEIFDTSKREERSR